MEQKLHRAMIRGPIWGKGMHNKVLNTVIPLSRYAGQVNHTSALPTNATTKRLMVGKSTPLISRRAPIQQDKLCGTKASQKLVGQVPVGHTCVTGLPGVGYAGVFSRVSKGICKHRGHIVGGLLYGNITGQTTKSNVEITNNNTLEALASGLGEPLEQILQWVCLKSTLCIQNRASRGKVAHCKDRFKERSFHPDNTCVRMATDMYPRAQTYCW
jgi:hypothetical protein